MTTLILEEHRTRVKVIETHDFKSEAACLPYFQQQKQEASSL